MTESSISTLSFRDFKLDRLAIHEIPKTSVTQKASTLPSYSDAETVIDAETTDYLKIKLAKSFRPERRYAIKFVESTTSNARFVISNLFNQKEDFLEATRRLADMLHRVQTGGSPEGLLLVMVGRLEGLTVALVTKLEKESATRAKWIEAAEGRSIALDFLREIILSQKTKLYKAAVFYKDNEANAGFAGFICDAQVARHDISANFFLRSFLGCELVGDAKVETKNFIKATKGFIFSDMVPAPRQASYRLHLASYVASNVTTLRPSHFAMTYLDEEHRESYRRWMRESRVQDRNILKDTSLVPNAGDVRVGLDEVSLAGPATAFEDQVVFRPLRDGRTKAEITGRLRDL